VARRPRAALAAAVNLALIALAVAVIVVAVIAYRYGWRAATAAAASLVGVAALLFTRRGKGAPEPQKPPEGPAIGPVRRTAGDIIARRAAEDREAIEAGDAEDVADIMREQK
jgi:sugar phosphate permease